MNKNDYKKIFIRFLKEEDLYEGWILQMKSYFWKKLIHEFFEYTDPVFYINDSVVESWHGRNEFNSLNKELIAADFKWKLILSKLDNKYWDNVLSYINSYYFDPLMVGYELYNMYKDLRNKNTSKTPRPFL